MRPRPRQTLIGLVAVAALFLDGCRLPKPYLATRLSWPRLATETEEVGETPGSCESKHGPIRRVSTSERPQYRETLARPVAIIDLQPEVSSTWQILYATNRGPDRSSQPGMRRYGRTINAVPEYGVSTVVLPHRERGDAGRHTSADKSVWANVVPAAWRGEKVDRHDRDTALTARLTRVEPLGRTTFGEQLRELTARSPQRDVLVFVHGFNVSYDEAILRATQVAADLPFNGAIVAYSWPSQGGVDSYERDGEVVNESELAFTEFLTTIGDALPDESRINIVVHSMGNRLVQRSLWRLPDRYASPPRFDEVVFCAPDVGVDEFRRNVRQARKVARRVTLYQCCNDAALIASMFRNKEERAGSPNAPVLIEGMDTIETAPVDSSALGHSYYGSNTSVLRDLFAIVKEHAPAAERPWLQSRKMPFQKTPLWIFSSFPEELDWNWSSEAEAVMTSEEDGSAAIDDERDVR